jgi:hypothetical protein
MTVAPDDSPDGPTPTGVLHLRTWLPAELHEPFSAWCDTHHLEQLAVPGFRRVRRFSVVRSLVDDPPRYLTIYDLDHLEVLDGPDYAAYRERSRGLPDFLQGRLRAARSDAWLVAGVPALAGLVPGGAGLAHLFVPAAPDLADWFAEHGLAVVDAAGGTSARLLRSGSGEQIVLVELPDAPEALDPADLPVPGAGRGADAPAWGLYRLDFVATAAS